jgi:hypothetical protein
LENNGDHTISFLCAAHPLFTPSPGCSLDLPDSGWSLHSSSFAQRDARLPSLTTLINGSRIHLADWDQVPHGMYAKLFIPWSDGHAVTLRHPSWRVAIAVTCERAPIQCHLGLWLNRRGFPRNAPLSHIAIEPTFGSSDDLEAVIRDGTCLRVVGGAIASWRVVYRVVWS